MIIFKLWNYKISCLLVIHIDFYLAHGLCTSTIREGVTYIQPYLRNTPAHVDCSHNPSKHFTLHRYFLTNRALQGFSDSNCTSFTSWAFILHICIIFYWFFIWWIHLKLQVSTKHMKLTIMKFLTRYYKIFTSIS